MKNWIIRKLGGVTLCEYESSRMEARKLQNKLDTLWVDEYLIYGGKEFTALPKRDAKTGRFTS
jgi:hypothetical protein